MSERSREASLDLRTLGDGSMIGLSSEVGASLAQAAAVCLQSQGHAQGVLLVVGGVVTANLPMIWQHANDQARRSWANEIDATEDGAAGIAIVFARHALGYVVTSRAYHGSGFDYWLGRTTSTQPLHNEIRLEVSGIRNGSAAKVAKRIREKISQMTVGGVQSPGYAVVVEFGNPRARVEKP